MKSRRSGDPWSVAAGACLLAGAVLLVVAWYDVSGTANVYEQLPYLVSAGFTGLALIIVGSALLVAGRSDRTERRLAQLIDALTEARAAGSESAPEATPSILEKGSEPAAGDLLVAAGGTTYHRPGCLLLRDKSARRADVAEVASQSLTPCPVCDPEPPAGRT